MVLSIVLALLLVLCIFAGFKLFIYLLPKLWFLFVFGMVFMLMMGWEMILAYTSLGMILGVGTAFMIAWRIARGKPQNVES